MSEYKVTVILRDEYCYQDMLDDKVAVDYVRDALDAYQSSEHLSLYKVRASKSSKVANDSASHNTSSDEIPDYNSGLMNDYGGGNVGWWQDYIREEVGRCNDYWRSATSHIE